MIPNGASTATTAGLTEQLRSLTVGDTLSRVARVKVAERGLLQVFRKNASVALAKTPGEFVTQTLDGISEDHEHALRVLVVTRVA